MENQEEEVSVVFTSPSVKALNNSLVLRTIMNNLDARDLLRFRLVSKIWKEEATSQLLSTRPTNSHRSKFHQVAFEWDKKLQLFRNKLGTLSEFTANYCTSNHHDDDNYNDHENPRSTFPCTQFAFLDLIPDPIGVAEVPADLSDFLSHHGHHVKMLRLLLCGGSHFHSASACKLVRKIVFEKTPRLKSLSLEFPFCGPAFDAEASKKLDQRFADLFLNADLPSLNDLQELYLADGTPFPYDDLIVLQPCKRLVLDILKSAPNLQEISEPYLCFTEEIVSTGKLNTVHHIRWDGYQSTMSRFITFSRAQPQLTSLHFDQEGWTNLFTRSGHPSLLRVLQSSRISLKFFRLRGRFFYEPPDDLEIPILENVEQLFFEEWSTFDGGRGKMLPEGFTLQNSFPKLKALTVKGVENAHDSLNFRRAMRQDNPFESESNASTTVETLAITPDTSSSFDPVWLRHALLLYPNVRTLDLDIHRNWNHIFKVCDTIWRSWDRSLLEELKITVHSPSCPFERNFPERMDELITGLDTFELHIQTLNWQRRQRDAGLEIGQLDPQQLNRGPSIFNMTKLKLFQLTGQPSCGSPIFTRVALIHGVVPMRRRQSFKMVVNAVELGEEIPQLNADFWRTLYQPAH